MDQLYSNPDLVAVYDVLNDDRSDFDFYKRQLPAPPVHVLDIGCGTGAFSIALANTGYQVTGLDPAPAMISFARSKSGAHAVSWCVGTIADLPQNEAYDVMVMTGHAFQCLLDDQTCAAFFEDVAQRLTPSGQLLFETRNPATRPWTRWTPARARPPMALPTGDTVQVMHDVESVHDDLVTFRETYTVSTRRDAYVSRSTLRFLPLSKIKDLAQGAGLEIAAVWGDWDGGTLREGSPEIILRLQRSSAGVS